MAERSASWHEALADLMTYFDTGYHPGDERMEEIRALMSTEAPDQPAEGPDSVPGLVLDFAKLRARIQADYAAAPEAVQALHDEQVTCRWGDIATLAKHANDLAGVVAGLVALDPFRPFSIYDDAERLCRVCRTWFPRGRAQFLEPRRHLGRCPWAQAQLLYADLALAADATRKGTTP